MIRSFRYQLSPTPAQERTLLRWLDLTRELYNAGLEERRDAWQKQRKSVALFDQIRQLPDVKKSREEFSSVGDVVLRGALGRLDRTFKNFIRRQRGGGGYKAGFPRFKGKRQFTSLLIDDLSGGAGKIIAGGRRVQIPRIGKVKFRQHRPLEGVPKMMRVVQEGRRWFVSFFCAEVLERPLPKTGREVGVDLGLTHFAATSDEEIFANPRPRGAGRIAIERAQRRLMRRKRGSHRRREAARLLAKKHARVANVRRENHISVANALVARYDTIFVEALTVEGLASGKLAKPVRDAAWGLFLKWLHAKAESAGREVIEVDPRYTSQTCPRCGAVEAKTLKQREHRCVCGLVLDRDVAAAQVILGLGRSLRGAAPLVEGRQRSAKVKSRRRRETGDAQGDK